MINSPEDAARLAMGDPDSNDPLPPGPNYGPFGYFRLAILIFAAVVAVLTVINLW
ncbi:hypothetical protein [Chelativorans sp. YIM 93263]|uniref:hypothetical protein n=1 Tax=Chelativorans sp. YIM 93263 TaxID=2906648 RepID=UPI0023781D8E|nr:hypothetical protein [Chelativorans sp. YIM 93263]